MAGGRDTVTGMTCVTLCHSIRGGAPVWFELTIDAVNDELHSAPFASSVVGVTERWKKNSVDHPTNFCLAVAALSEWQGSSHICCINRADFAVA